MLRRPRRARRRSLLAGTTTVAALVLAAGVAGASAAGVPVNPFGSSQVGISNQEANGRIMLPDNQSILPFGQRTTLTGAEPVGTAVSPDGTKAAMVGEGYGSVFNGEASIRVLDAATGKTLQTLQNFDPALPAGTAGGTPTYSSPPVYSPDGTALYAATANNDFGVGTDAVLKYTVGADGLVTDPDAPQTIALPGNLTYGLAVSADGTKLFAAMSGANAVVEIDTTTNTVVTAIPVGNAPQAVAVVGNQVFVSNRGGRRALPGDTTDDVRYGAAGGVDTPIVSSPVTSASTTGTVSVLDVNTGQVTDTINVGLQPTSMTVHDGAVFVTNTNSDTVSVIDTKSHRVIQTFNVEPLPGSTVGAAPNSVAFAGAHTLLVSVGRDNAIAEFGYNGPRTPVRYQGLIPTDWYPNQVSYDGKVGKVIVSNQQGIGAEPIGTADPEAGKSLAVDGTLTLFAPPNNPQLGTLTSQVFHNNGWDHLPPSNQKTGPDDDKQGGPLPAIPTRLGQPSAIKHVFLIVKENRAYDVVLGDSGKGNSDPGLATLGAQLTPNEHSLAGNFTQFDNFYDNGQVSADGHNWLVQADNNDYLEQQQATIWGRSFPFPGGDALAYQRDGFIWNTVEAAGKMVKNYGEFEPIANGAFASIPGGEGGTWQQYYADSQILEGQASGPLPVPLNALDTSSDIPSLEAISDPEYPPFDEGIPDQYRVDLWEQDLKKAEQTGSLPNLTIMQLPNDHGGTSRVNTINAAAADNDLAVGRIVSDISHSQFWNSSAIFVLEDDTQNGPDHVDGHRGPLWIASPYVNRGALNSSYYSEINVVKTIEQILGAQPLNQLDRAAVPMFDAFTNKPNLAPYDAVAENTPITQGVTGLIPLTPASTDPSAAARLAATNGPPAPLVPASRETVAAKWANWDRTEAAPKLIGAHARPDSVNPAQLNRYNWYSSTNWSKPYPGDKEILAPDQVPGRNLPTSFLGN